LALAYVTFRKKCRV